MTRICSSCEQEKPLTTEFFGIDRQRFMARCRACHAAASRQRWRSNPNAKALDKALRLRKRDSIRAYDQMRSKRDRVKKRASQKRWRENNRARQRQKGVEYTAKRRALIKGAGGRFSADDIVSMIKAQKGKCWWCDKKITHTPEVDHRIPLSRGGTNDRSNLVIACRPCNRSKSAKMPWEFAGRLL